MNTERLECKNIWHDLSRTLASELISRSVYPWDVIPHIKEFILSVGQTLPADGYDEVSDGIWIAKNAVISRLAEICAPCIIGAGTELRVGAYLRGGTLIGEGCVIGNSTELKNCILFDEVRVPHFNYVGDSVLGFHSHLGAGAVISNVRGDRSAVTVKVGEEKLPTGLSKFGAALGDFAEIGCGCVLNPGTIVPSGAVVHPLTSVSGLLSLKRK